MHYFFFLYSFSIQAIDLHALVGYIGGYIGLFLGYTFLHLPQLFSWVYQTIKTNIIEHKLQNCVGKFDVNNLDMQNIGTDKCQMTLLDASLKISLLESNISMLNEKVDLLIRNSDSNLL